MDTDICWAPLLQKNDVHFQKLIKKPQKFHRSTFTVINKIKGSEVSWGKY